MKNFVYTVDIREEWRVKAETKEEAERIVRLYGSEHEAVSVTDSSKEYWIEEYWNVRSEE